MHCKVIALAAFVVLLSACASLPPPESPPTQVTPAPQARAQNSEALLQALLSLGIDYRPGGRSPVTGFDCSGLVAHVFAQAYGMKLPHNVRAQSEIGAHVQVAQLEAGDLVFYNTLNRPFSHVGIYLGDGRFLHAPKSGSRVRVESIKAAYWAQRFNGARRIEPPL